MKKLIAILAIFLASTAYAENSKIEVRGSVDDGTNTYMSSGLITKYFASGARQQQAVTLTASAFTTISIPVGSRAILIDMLSADGLKLKGLTGDQGISIDATCPVLLPISSDGTTTVGIQNLETSSQRINVFFL